MVGAIGGMVAAIGGAVGAIGDAALSANEDPEFKSH